MSDEKRATAFSIEKQVWEREQREWDAEKAELAALREQHARDQMLMGELAELRELQASMAALLRDKERWDYLTERGGYVSVSHLNGPDAWEVYIEGRNGEYYGKTPRESVDAAMREET